jgi:hypothetical protein
MAAAEPLAVFFAGAGLCRISCLMLYYTAL